MTAQPDTPKHGPAPWARWLLLAALGMHLAMLGSLFWGYLDPAFSESDINPRGVDFFASYEAGRSALEGRSVYHYEPEEPDAAPYYSPFRYVPAFAYVVGVPLTALEPWHAYWGWVAFTELLLVANCLVVWRLAGGGTWAVVGAAMWLAFTPFYLEQYLGQFSFFMATALLWVGIGVMRGREANAGPPWVVSLLVKSNSALLVPLLMRLRWWRTLVAGALAAVAGTVPFFLWRPDDGRYFVWANASHILDQAGIGFLAFRPAPGEPYFFVERGVRLIEYNSGELGLTALLRNAAIALDSTSTGAPGALIATVLVAVLGLSLVATFLTRNADPLALFAVWVSTFFLLYTAWEQHYVMLLPALTLLVAFRPVMRPIALLAFVFVALPTPYWLLDHVWNTGPLPPDGMLTSHQEVWPAWGVLLQHTIKPVPVALLWSYLVGAQLWSGLRLP